MLVFFLLFLSVSTAKGHNHRPFEPWGLEVLSQDKTTATITWQSPDAGSYTGFWLRLFSPSTGESEGLDLNDGDDVATIRQLKPNTTYNLELYTVLDDTLSQYASTRTFTTLPAEPQDVFATEITETDITVKFNTSSFSDDPNRRYVFTISPTVNDPASDILFFLEDSSRTFDRLVSGRLYTISGYTAINEELSDPKIAQFRTVPLSPTKDDEFQQHSSMPTSFRVSWYPPSRECDFERYHVTVYWYGNDDDENYKHRVTTFVAHSSVGSHKFNNLPHGKKFYVHVRTVSGVGTTTEQFSKPLILAVTKKEENVTSENFNFN